MEQDYVDKQIDAKIIEINNNDNIYEIGSVVNVRDFIIEVTGINNVMFYEKINIANKAIGYVNSINENTVTVAVLKIDSPINVGDMVYSTNVLYTGSYSPSSFGRVIDLFGVDKLSGKVFSDLVEMPIERKTIPIMDRGTVNRPLLTGITGIDLMYPIGRGQRQLIIGDKRTGKTQIGLDTIVNQKNQNVLCFYVAIGKTKKEVKNIYSELMKKGALDYTTIITAFNDELPPVISLIPYFALSIAEDYMMQGYDVLVVIDDLKRHAEAYREISLISGKTPGRDAYPADIFYTHSRLLEKGCQHKNGGSVTILPIVETKGGDITDYISTNIISITDGQIVLSEKSFQKGEKPAINYGLSVSRLGGAVQDKEMKIIGSAVRRKLLSYLETRSVYELVNMDEMSFELKNSFMEGKIILGNMMQYKFSPKSPQEMMDMFIGIVDTEEESDANETSQIIESNNEVFENNNTIPEDGSVFDNSEVVSDKPKFEVNQMPEEVPVNQMPKEVPVVNQMPEEIVVNQMPEEVTSEEVSQVITDTPVEVSVDDNTLTESNELSQNDVALEVNNEETPIESNEEVVIDDSASVTQPEVSEVVETSVEETPASEEVAVDDYDITHPEVADAVETTPQVEEEVVEEVPVEQTTFVSPEDVMSTVEIKTLPTTPEEDSSPFEGSQIVSSEEVSSTVDEKELRSEFNPMDLSMGVEQAASVEEEPEIIRMEPVIIDSIPADLEDSIPEVDIESNINLDDNISQDVVIDNPQTEVDESIEENSVDLDNVSINYDFDVEEEKPIYEEDSSNYVDNTNNDSFDPNSFNVHINEDLVEEVNEEEEVI
ncbi:MAG: hypothetical protein IKH54_04230 [Bacilli bacterium]|nr:hypothetical protein [Bacilli bacterium]